ncbi:MAG TPA: hypothetical protein VFA41_12015 [Ktedonobacteraceae bacterium]|jgi:DNA-directed RNA polymerase specialized sigma24 family protein|nr:hypothetical protein [Ktedonobacteraceae bacterium]
MVSPNGTPLSQDNFDWLAQLQKLNRFARKLVYNSGLWRGQEEDKAQDIASDGILHTLNRLDRAKRKNLSNVRSLDSLSKTCTFHCFIDEIRKDKRIVLFSQLSDTSYEADLEESSIDYIGLVDDRLFYIGLWTSLAEDLEQFPDKRRHAFLIEMASMETANKMHPDLKQAFQEAGVHLADPQYSRPTDERERTRIAALVSLAYRQVAQLPKVQYYIAGM